MKRLLLFILAATMLEIGCSKNDMNMPKPQLYKGQVYGFSDLYGEIDTTDNYKTATYSDLPISYFSGDSFGNANVKLNYEWTTSDGQTFNTMQPNIHFSKQGNYTLTLNVKDENNNLIYTKNKSIQVENRSFGGVSIDKGWNWYGLSVYNDSLNWNDTTRADVYFVVKKSDSAITVFNTAAGDFGGEVILKSSILKNVSPSDMTPIFVSPNQSDTTAFPFFVAQNNDSTYYHYELFAVKNGVAHLWQTDEGYGTGQCLDVYYTNGQLNFGAIHFGFDVPQLTVSFFLK